MPFAASSCHCHKKSSHFSVEVPLPSLPQKWKSTDDGRPGFSGTDLEWPRLKTYEEAGSRWISICLECFTVEIRCELSGG